MKLSTSAEWYSSVNTCLHAPQRLQGCSLKLAGLQILQRSSRCRKLLMDDASPCEGCGCLPPEARITDGQWALTLNTRCPWLVCLLILYQWLCKRCTPIIHTDEHPLYSILELQCRPLTWVTQKRLCCKCCDELIQCQKSPQHQYNTIIWRELSMRSGSQEKHSWKRSVPWNISYGFCVGVCVQLLILCLISVRQAFILLGIYG